MGFGTSKFGQLGFLWAKLQALVDELRSRETGCDATNRRVRSQAVAQARGFERARCVRSFGS